MNKTGGKEKTRETERALLRYEQAVPRCSCCRHYSASILVAGIAGRCRTTSFVLSFLVYRRSCRVVHESRLPASHLRALKTLTIRSNAARKTSAARHSN